jgi:hypothetical protein
VQAPEDRHDAQVFGRGAADEARREDFAILGAMLMRMDAKLDLILKEMDIDDGEETDHF